MPASTEPTQPARRPRGSRRARRATGILVTAVAAFAVLATGAASPDARQSSADIFRDVIALVHSRFVDGLEGGDLYERAARGVVKELGDPYSELLSPKDLAAFSMATLGRYGGVGMEVLGVGDTMLVLEVYPGTPSAAAGLRRGDRLVRVDGASVAGLGLDTVVGRLRGKPGSAVRVAVDRSGEAVEVAMRRVVVQRPAVDYAWVERGIGYVPLPAVTASAGADVEAALREVERRGARGVVLDLRGNGGGSVDEAVRVLGALLPEGAPAVEIRERGGTTVLRTDDHGVHVALPVVVLQDGRSASATEIITGALQDHDRALVVGSTSYGKGLAQTVYPLDGGWALKLTTARWYTPVGRSIHRDRTAGDSAHRAAETTAPSAGGPTMRHLESFGGRALVDSGGIVPDVRVAGDTLLDAERALVRRLAAMPRSADEINRVALRLGRALAARRDTTFAVQPAWRDTLRVALEHAGAALDSAEWRGASRYVDRLLEQRIATLAFGRALADRRALRHDPQFLAADSLLRITSSAKALVQRRG